MNFDLHFYGETPEELLNVLAHLGHADSNYHTPIPNERHPAQAPTSQPQSAPAPQPEKQKAPAPTKPKKAAQKPAAAPAEKQPEPPAEEPEVNPTTAQTSASDEPQASTPAQTAPSEATATAPTAEPEKDPARENEIRTHIMKLMRAGRRDDCVKIISKFTSKGISSLPPESYTEVEAMLCELDREVNGNAAG